MNLSCGPFTAVIVLILLSAVCFVDGNNKHRKCRRKSHCLTQKRTVLGNVSQTESNTNQSLWRNGSKKLEQQEEGTKRDTAFTDVLKNLLLMVDKAKPKSTGINSPSQKSTARLPKPISNAAGEHHSKTATTPGHPSATAASMPSPTLSSVTTGSTSEVTSASAGTVTSSPSPTEYSATTTTLFANVSCAIFSDQPSCPTKTPPLSKPGVPSSQNISVAPGVVITSEGQIILNPHIPLLPTVAPKPVLLPSPSAGTAPFPVIQIPGSALSLAIDGEWPDHHHAQEAEQGECVNKFKHCTDWASKGECVKNAAFMTVNCRRSCTQCAPCENEQSQCVEWAKNGECLKNFVFMEQKCWRSCSKCAPCVDNRPLKCLQWAKKDQCALNRKYMEQKCWKSCSGCEKCENKNARCLEWAENGQCTKTPQFMMHFCWKSCSSCASCVDKYPKKCPVWAEKDQCKKNRKFMEENCWRSCSKCCKDKNKHCVNWAKRGECTKNPDFMNEHCPMTCNVC